MEVAEMGRYALSFTSGGLLLRESTVVLPVYLTTGDWAATQREVIARNLMQSRTAASSVRIARETVQRLGMLSEGELQYLAEASPTEACHLMWAATCRRYDLIGEFAEEVLRERFLLMTPTLNREDLDRFLTGKTLWHPELDELKPSTKAKLRQSIFRMLHEADLCSDDGTIVPVVLSERIQLSLTANEPSDIRFFPTNLTMEATR